MQVYKNIIFDLGGVLLTIDFERTNRAFQALGVKNFQAFFSQHHAHDLFERLEKGQLSPQAFYAEFKEATGLPLTDAQIKEAWNAMLLHYSAEKMQWLHKLKTKYNLYLFSNTNEIHHKYFTQLFRAEIGGELDSYFVKAWYSHRLGIRKPYPQSFLKILNQENLCAAETLFIDDTIGNIQGAQEAGLHTYHLDFSKTILDLPL